MKTQLQLKHRRQSSIPEAFAEATLSAAVLALSKNKKRDRVRTAQQVARLRARGEL